MVDFSGAARERRGKPCATLMFQLTCLISYTVFQQELLLRTQKFTEVFVKIDQGCEIH